MRITRFITAIVLLTILMMALAPGRAAAQGPPPMPKPGPEHDLFKMDEGTWDAVVEFMSGPGAPPMTSKGVEVTTVGCGGLCAISDFKGEAMGSAFHGHGVVTWDARKKKYVGSWTDSMSAGLAATEATWDPAGKRFDGTMEVPTMTGEIVKSRSVLEYRPDGTRVMTGYTSGPDGKEIQVMRITYTKRK